MSWKRGNHNQSSHTFPGSRIPSSEDNMNSFITSASFENGPLLLQEGKVKNDGTIQTPSSLNGNEGEQAHLLDKQRNLKILIPIDSPDLKDAQLWSIEEDVTLLQLQAAIGNKWSWIAQKLPGRSESQVKTRFKSILRAKQRMWSEEEDDLLLKMRDESTDWDKIVKLFPKRTKNGLRVRYRQLQYMKRGAVEKLNPGSPRQAILSGYNNDIVEKKNWEKSNPISQAHTSVLKPKRLRDSDDDDDEDDEEEDDDDFDDENESIKAKAKFQKSSKFDKRNETDLTSISFSSISGSSRNSYISQEPKQEYVHAMPSCAIIPASQAAFNPPTIQAIPLYPTSQIRTYATTTAAAAAAASIAPLQAAEPVIITNQPCLIPVAQHPSYHQQMQQVFVPVLKPPNTYPNAVYRYPANPQVWHQY